VDTLPPAIVYEKPIFDIRMRSASMQSNMTADTFESEGDPEVAMHEGDVPDSPATVLRKKFSEK
jgi:hypothetical protein